MNQNVECEEKTIINPEVVQAMRDKLMDERSIMRLVDFYKLFSDVTRLKILYLLSMSEMCVCDISAALDMNQSTISHQLKTLRNSRLIRYRREGKVVYYSLDDEHIGQVLLQGMLHVSEM
ncbi:MAG: helix-turn-helix transcriptional regulator [Christensenellaceae bacterium]|jgi:transcriptional regulator, arsR family|nr:helix-turn-helix transcriptional regulator [Christensenellaceae bacterium]MBS6564402.1 helix-turn-helix transcriptional regulator [Clostridiales bacterium]PWM00949.1 MAG: transcriptional regulator [Selenomonadales bacterium]